MSDLPELPYKMYTKSDAELLMRDYGKACARAAMERAAQICDEIAETRMRMDLSFTAAQKSAAAIRAEIEKEEAK